MREAQLLLGESAVLGLGKGREGCCYPGELPVSWGMHLTWAASCLREEARLGLRGNAPLPGCVAEGHASGCPAARTWELRPGRRRAIDIPVRQPVAELLLFLFF